MTQLINSGIPGVTLTDEDHVCGLYWTRAERDAVLLPFLRAGLQAGDRCLCIIDEPDHPDVLARLADDLDVTRCVACGQLALVSPANTYLGTGRFSAEDTLRFLAATAGERTTGTRGATGPTGTTCTAAADAPVLRVAGDASWLLATPPGVDHFDRYEAAMNDLPPRHRSAVLCLYDLSRFAGGRVLDVLRFHPKAMLDRAIMANPFFVARDEATGY